MAECKKRLDWDKWKETIEAEITSLNKRKVFSAVRPTPPGILPVGYKWVFVRKRNENNEVVRCKSRLVAQGFTQRPGVDFNGTYSPVMSGITFRYLISLAVQNRLSMQLMDVVTAYLYGSLDSDIYMKVPGGIHVPSNKENHNMYCIKLQKSLYGLKQLGLGMKAVGNGRENTQTAPAPVFVCREQERDRNSRAGIRIRYYGISGAGYNDREHVGNGRESINKREHRHMI
jgi:hypothetical protein